MSHSRLRFEGRLNLGVAVAAAAFGLIAGSPTPAAAGGSADIRFVPGVYYLDDYVPGAPVAPPTDTLTVVVSGGVASFNLSGTDNATFSVPDPSVPTGTDIDDDGLFNPYYQIQTSAISASWDTSLYPWLTFWSAGIGGGVTAGSIPGDFGSNLFDTSGSTIGPSQVFAVPEPETWILLLTGFAGIGAAVRRRATRSGFAMPLNKPGRPFGIFAALFSILLCVFPSSAAQAQQFTKTADGPNYLYAKELSDSILQVKFSLLGYSFAGDAAYEDPGDWDVGPHFSPIINSATPGNTQAIGRIFWLEPGSSMSDLPDAKFVGFDLAECFCGAVGPAISIVSDLTWANLQDSGGSEQDFGCILGAPGVVTSCPILENGQSETIPIGDYGGATGAFESDDPMIVQFTDLRSGAVPEPETWAMMLMGLGAMGAAMRLHRFWASEEV